MQLTSQQVKEILHIGDTKLSHLVKDGTLKPVNAKRPDAKKFFAKFDSKQVNELKKGMKVSNGAVRSVQTSKKAITENPFTRLDRIEEKLDKLINMWK